MPGSLSFPLSRLVWMRRARLVPVLARLARTLGGFDRVSVMPLLSCALSVGLLHIDHDCDSISLLPSRKRWQATDEPRTAEIHARIDVETSATGVE
jgi:hypothetical protein